MTIALLKTTATLTAGRWQSPEPLVAELLNQFTMSHPQPIDESEIADRVCGAFKGVVKDDDER